MRGIAFALSLCVAVAAVAPCVSEGAAGQNAPASSSTEEHPEHEAVRGALAGFFMRAQAGRREEAAASCHSTDEAERAMGLAMATLLHSQTVCRMVAEVKLGADVANAAFPGQITVQDIRAAKVEIRGAHARLTFKPGASFRLAKVDGTWKLSMPGTCRQEKQSALTLASFYVQLAHAHLMTIRDIDEGRVETASRIQASIQVNLNTVGEQMRAKQEAGARAE